MPELPEVEASRRLLESALCGRRLTVVEVAPDDIVLSGHQPEVVMAATSGQTVARVGRKGKYFWIEFEEGGCLFGHLGMTGAMLDLTPGQERYVHYRRTKADEGLERPRFLKLWLETEDGRRIAMVDGRRLSRLWLGAHPDEDARVKTLGPDAYHELPEPSELYARLARRKAPIKAVLLDQGFLAGIGNYLADEVLYHAGVAPGRLASSLSEEEAGRLHAAIRDIIGHAVDVDADYEKFPPTWIFHARWGGARGSAFHEGEELVRETIGGRTTAWVPTRQR